MTSVGQQLDRARTGHEASVRLTAGRSTAADGSGGHTVSWAARLQWARRHGVGLALTATLLVHLLSLSRRLGSDEGGYAMVARFWRDGGRYLYGPSWVDRPPGLVATFAVADHLGPFGVRLLATLVALGLVGALAWAAGAVGGRPAARWAAWAGFAFGSSELLEAQQLNGELLAATLVTVSIGATLRAVRVARSRWHTAWLGLVAGAAAAGAVLVKQNFVDGLAFLGVLLLCGLSTRANRATYRPARVLVAAGAAALGVLGVVALAVGWAARHGGVRALGYAMYGFRADASAVIARGSFTAPVHRLEGLLWLGTASGLLVLLVHLVVSNRGRLRRASRLDPLPWALAVAAGVELAGVFGGENFWPHYLIALVPTVAVAAALSTGASRPGSRWTKRLVVLAVAVTAVASPVAAVTSRLGSSESYTTGRWIAAAAHPRDTVVVAFTHANVVNASGLRPGYPYGWSLPVRTRDPRLSLLTRTLDSRSAPTWVVRWDQPHTWGLDPGNRVEQVLRTRYRPVGDVCGHAVWLHDGARRSIEPLPPPSACGGASG